MSPNIRTKIEEKAISLWIHGIHHFLSHEDVRQIRSEMNRILQHVHDEKKAADAD